jgi:hypothetical protein
MDTKNRDEDYRQLVRHILETCPGTTLEQAQRIAQRMIEDPEADLLDIMTI